MKLFDEIPYIENEQVILHKIEEKDAPALQEISKDEEYKKYIPKFAFENQLEGNKETVSQLYEAPINNKESILLGIYLKADDRLIGIAQLYKYMPNWNKVSIDVRLCKQCRQRDVALEAVELLKNYLFDSTDIKRITAHVQVDNNTLQQALTGAGFRLRKIGCEENWGKDESVLVNKYVIEKLGNIKYAKIGDGEKIMVILPGLAFKSTLGSADLVEASYKDVFKDYTIYLFDDRSNIGKDYSIRERAGDVAAEMKSLHIKNACVFGTSMGGMVGQYLTIDHPTLVKKLYITSTTPYLMDEARPVVEKWKTLAQNGEMEKVIHESVKDIYSPTTVEKYGPAIESAIGYVTDKEMADFIALIDAIEKFNCYDELSKIQCPVKIIGSLGDKVLLPKASELIAEKCGGELYMYGEEYGHGVYDEAPDFKQRMLEFFERE